MGECDKSNAVEQLFYFGFGFIGNGHGLQSPQSHSQFPFTKGM